MVSVAAPDAIASRRARGHHADSRQLSRAMVGLLIGYVALVLVLMVLRGAYMSPDLFVVLSLVIAVALGRTRLFLRDWLPFAAIFLAWESMRGLADDLGAAVHSNDVIALERFFFGGHVPSEVLQAAFHVRGSVNFLDVGATFLYIAHFALPLVVAFVFWAVERRLFYRYLLALMLMSFAAFACYLMLPVAPPRFAGSFGEALAVEDIARTTLTQLNVVPVTTWLYGSISGNPVAAFPSLHSAYPLLACLFVRTRWPRASLVLLAWSAAIWLSVVYLGHHYVIDVVAGIAFAAMAYAAVGTSGLGRAIGWLTQAAPWRQMEANWGTLALGAAALLSRTRRLPATVLAATRDQRPRRRAGCLSGGRENPAPDVDLIAPDVVVDRATARRLA